MGEIDRIGGGGTSGFEALEQLRQVVEDGIQPGELPEVIDLASTAVDEARSQAAWAAHQSEPGAQVLRQLLELGAKLLEVAAQQLDQLSRLKAGDARGEPTDLGLAPEEDEPRDGPAPDASVPPCPPGQAGFRGDGAPAPALDDEAVGGGAGARPGRQRSAGKPGGGKAAGKARPPAGVGRRGRSGRADAPSAPARGDRAERRRDTDGVRRSSGTAPTAPAGSVQGRVLRFRDEIEAAARKHGVPPALVAAYIEVESGGNPNARSFDGGHGKGLLQIDDRSHSFARTARVFDPAANLDYGARLIRSNLSAFPGNTRAGIAAFNAGQGAVRSALDAGRDPSSATYSRTYISKVLEGQRRYERYF